MVYGSDLKVVYEEALMTHQLGSTGLMGHVTKQQALNCLHNCPLLADLHLYSNWSSIFQSQLGDLKQFIIQHGGVVSIKQDSKPSQPIETLEIVAIETEDGRLLKLALKSDWTDLEKAVTSRDARQTSGHMVSYMVCEGGVKHFSGELYVNKLKVALIREFMRVEEGVGGEGGAGKGGVVGEKGGESVKDDVDDAQNDKDSTALKSVGTTTKTTEEEPSCNENLAEKPTTNNTDSTTTPTTHPDNSLHDKDSRAREGLKWREAGDPSEDVVHFLLQCVVLIPKRVAVFLVPRVILEVLNDVVGNVKSKTLLLQAAEKDASKLEYLAGLGLSLGIPQWYEKVYDKKLHAVGVTKCHKRYLSDDDDDAVIKKIKIGSDDDDDDVEFINECDFKKNKIGFKKDDDDDDVSSDDSACYVKISEDGAKNSTEVGDMKGDHNKANSDKGTTGDDVKNDDVSGSKETKSESEPLIPGGDAFNEDNSQHWKQLVDKIRTEEFGVGVALGSEGQTLLAKQQERLGRSLQRLSADLYSKNTHFVLELVQNADDNNYSHDPKCRPSLVFKVSKDGVEVLNNERGFRSQDLRAVCDVGKTTKGKHMVGYIGQKGIGFKSIYRVTDTPQIHSRGLHVSFDVHSKPLGYILPQWLEDASMADVAVFDGKSYRTRIVLPIKESLKGDVSIRTSFSDLHPSLLLFLHRLKRIIVADQVSGETRSMSRHDLSDNVVLIKHNNKAEKWVLIRRRVDVSEVSDEAKSGVNIQSTEVAMAFPMKREYSNEGDVRKHLPAKMPVFAFLPLRSYGFRFIIHADFDIPSSREDVHDSLWNQWLRSKLHLLFLDALHFFKHADHLPVDDVLIEGDVVGGGGDVSHGAEEKNVTSSPIKTTITSTEIITHPKKNTTTSPTKPTTTTPPTKNTTAQPTKPPTTPPTTTKKTTPPIPPSVLRVANFLRFLPQPGEVLDFFRQVSFNIINALKTSPCLPSCDGDWCLPSQLLICTDITTLQHIPCQLLYQQTGLKYIHPHITASLEASLLLHLGVQRLNAKHICEVGKAVVKSMTEDVRKFKAVRDSSIDQLSTWLSCIYRHTTTPTIDITPTYHTDDVNADVMEDLKEMTFIPLSGGRLVSLSSCQSVFFPFRSPVGSSSLTQETKDTLEGELNIIDRRLLANTHLHKEHRKHVMWVLEKMGVKDMDEDDVIDSHILPRLRQQNGSMASDPKIYVAYAHCLKARFCASSTPLDHVLLPILTNRGLKVASNDDVHFGDVFCSEGSLADHISSYHWTMVDTCYLGDNQSHSNVESWREFFLSLGVRDFLCFKKKTRIISRKVAIDTFPGHVNDFPANQSSFKFEDYTCSELIALLKVVRVGKDRDVRNEELKKVFHLMNVYWSDEEAKSRRSPNSFHHLNYVSHYLVAKIYPDDGVESGNNNDNNNNNNNNSNNNRSNNRGKVFEVSSSVEVYLKNTTWLPVYILHHRDVASLDSTNKCRNNTLYLEKEVEMEDALEISAFLQDPLKTPVESAFVRRFSRVAELKLVKCGVNIVGLCPQNFFYFAHHVSYTVICAEEMNSKMAEFLGIKVLVDKELVVEMFKQWTRKYGSDTLGESGMEGGEKGVFVDTYGRISRIYKFLETHLTRREVASLMHNRRFVFVKDTDLREMSDSMQVGVFVSKDKVCWNEGEGRCRDLVTDMLMLGNFERKVSLKQGQAGDDIKLFIPFVLCHLYRKPLESFFSDLCGIPPRPSLHIFLFFLIQISSMCPLNDKSHNDTMVALSSLWHALQDMKDESDRSMMVSKVVNIIKDLRVLPARRWSSLGDNPILVDDYDLHNIFSKVAGVNAINVVGFNVDVKKTSFKNNLEHDEVNKKAFDFLRLLGVETLTKCVSKNVISEKSVNSRFLKDYFFCMLPYVQKMLKSDFPTVYSHFVEFVDVKQLLNKIKFVQTQDLKLIYRLCIPPNRLLPTKTNFQKSFSASVNKACYLCDRTFYMNGRTSCSYSQLNNEIAGYFSLVNNYNLSQELRKVSDSCFKEIKTLLTEVSSLMLSNQQDQLMRLETERGYKPLPPDEDWAACITFNQEDVEGAGSFDVVTIKDDEESQEDAPQQSMPTSQTIPPKPQQHPISKPSSGPSIWPPTSDNAGFGGKSDAEMLRGIQSNLYNLANLQFSSKNTATPASSSTSYKNFCDLTVDTPKKSLNTEEKLPPLPEDLSQVGAATEEQMGVGREGEMMVMKYLQDIMKLPDSDIKEVVHVNADGDTVAPFDIKVVLSSGREVFIEVKATSGHNKRWFEVSLPELSYAVKYGEDYHVYRVSGVGKPSAKLLRIENLKDTLSSKQARLAVVLNSSE